MSTKTTRAERAYFLRTLGYKWAVVLTLLHPDRDPNRKAVKQIRRLAKHWASRREMAWPPELHEPTRQTPYEEQIEENRYARYAAASDPNVPLSRELRGWALEQGLAWPPPGRSQGERAYEAKSEGMPWSEVREHCGYAFIPGAVAGARRWADTQNLPWPVPNEAA